MKSLIVAIVASWVSIGALAEDRVGIMTFNVENLFDTVHDKGKEDYTFLPMSQKNTPAHKSYCASLERQNYRESCLNFDWTEARLEKKMDQLAKTVLQIQGGRGPDLLILQEVENRAVLERWNAGPLKPAGYGAPILIEGTDTRGIDVAIFSRLPLKGKPQLHDLGLMRKYKRVDTRGVLEAAFELPGGEKITLLGVHFPMPAHPPDWREKSFVFLADLLKKKGKDALVVAGGDFNVPSAEDAQRKTLAKFVQPHWIVSHQVGCAGCMGTMYYPPKKEWSFFDMLLLSKKFGDGAKKGWHLDPASVRIPVGYAEQKDAQGTPKSFDLETGQGVSDHWPFYVEIVRQ